MDPVRARCRSYAKSLCGEHNLTGGRKGEREGDGLFENTVARATHLLKLDLSAIIVDDQEGENLIRKFNGSYILILITIRNNLDLIG